MSEQKQTAVNLSATPQAGLSELQVPQISTASHHPARLAPIPGLDRPLSSELTTNLKILQPLLAESVPQQIRHVGTIPHKDSVRMFLEFALVPKVQNLRFFPASSRHSVTLECQRDVLSVALEKSRWGKDWKNNLITLVASQRISEPTQPLIALGFSEPPDPGEVRQKRMQATKELDRLILGHKGSGKREVVSQKDLQTTSVLLKAAMVSAPRSEFERFGSDLLNVVKSQVQRAWSDPFNPQTEALSQAWGTIIDLGALRDLFDIPGQDELIAPIARVATCLYLSPMIIRMNFLFTEAVKADRKTDAIAVVEQERELLRRLDSYCYLFDPIEKALSAYERQPDVACPLSEAALKKMSIREFNAVRALKVQIDRHASVLEGTPLYEAPAEATIDHALESTWHIMRTAGTGRTGNHLEVASMLLATPQLLNFFDILPDATLSGSGGYVRSHLRSAYGLDFDTAIYKVQIESTTSPNIGKLAQERAELLDRFAKALFPLLANFLTKEDVPLSAESRHKHLSELCELAEARSIRSKGIYAAHAKRLELDFEIADSSGDIEGILKAVALAHSRELTRNEDIALTIQRSSEQVALLLSEYISASFSAPVVEVTDSNDLLRKVANTREALGYLDLWKDVTGNLGTLESHRQTVYDRLEEIVAIYRTHFQKIIQADVAFREDKDPLRIEAAAIDHPIGAIRFIERQLDKTESYAASSASLAYLRSRVLTR